MQKSAPTNLSFYPDQPQVAVGAIVFKDDKVLLVLEQSRHGAENGDIEILQSAVIEFIEKYR